MSAIFKIHEAKTQLSRLIARAEAGEEIIIARDDKPVAKLVPMGGGARKKRVPGAMKGIWPALPDAFFFDPLPEEELAAWEGRSDESDSR
jgi:prevent-host-death family protein